MASLHQSSPSRHEGGVGDLPVLEFDTGLPGQDTFSYSNLIFRIRERIDSEDIPIDTFGAARKNSEGQLSELFSSNPGWVNEGSVAGLKADIWESLQQHARVHSLVVPTATQTATDVSLQSDPAHL